jgi:LSD1 subclass zinc finger protein
MRTFTCPGCGAATRSEAATAYVYCNHCGSYADYDFASLRWLSWSPEAREYTAYIGQRLAQKEELRMAGRRKSFQKMEREDWEYYISLVPEVHPKEVDTPGDRQDTYLEWWSQTAAERAFNPVIREQNDALAGFMSQLPWKHTPGGPGVIGYTLSLPGDSFLELAERYLKTARIEAGIFLDLGLTGLHPDRIPVEHYQRMAASSFIQAWSQFLDQKTISDYLEQYQLRGSYQWVPEKGEFSACSCCGSQLDDRNAEGEVQCNTCGHTVVLGGVPFNCTGCGAPLSLEPDADSVICPYCTTLSAVGTFDSFLGYR